MKLVQGLGVVRCHCKTGYYGNPYLLDGCQDINECADRSTHNCISNNNCRNMNGSFVCFCNKWYSGKGTKEAGCHPKILLIMVVTSVGFIALLVGMSTTYLAFQKRKLIKLKEKFFRQNGGFILQQQLSVREDSSHGRAQIFSAEELKKATKDYDESLIIGKGGYGLFSKGF
ncbi:hypothetical protein L6164_023482 [Bauhinia variegata]|uniref:Uncharacterized protein n=1 Tax=Bauhinia variegata TaxID=167791 RepID=A0ACB9MIY9_BAUVA|nr:hypothetical protein L6164_023482 [Bauhinia variegata]